MVKSVFSIFKQTFDEWKDDDVPRLSAALAYYAAFSMAPLLLVVIGVAGIVFGRSDVEQHLVEQISDLAGADAAEIISDLLEQSFDPETGMVATIIAIVMLLLGASGAFGHLQSALNQIWEVELRAGQGILGTIRARFISLTMVLGTGFLLLVSLVISAALALLDEVIVGLAPELQALLQVVNLVISFGVVTLLFAMLYKILPDVEIAWGDVWVGAAVTSLLFTVGKWAIGLYLGNSSTASAYGAAGSLVVLLLWVYYSAQILFFGAEFTQVYARRYGSRILPSEHAVRVITETRIAESGSVSEGERPPLLPEDPVPVGQIYTETGDDADSAKSNGGWFGGFLGGLVVAAVGLVVGLLWMDRDS